MPLIHSSAAFAPIVSPHGVYARVARREGVSRQFVHQVATGKRKSQRIQAALVDEISVIAERYGASVHAYRELRDEAAGYAESMDRALSSLDNRPDCLACRICYCRSDRRCAVPESQFVFFACRWNFQLDCCTNPACVDKAFRDAERSAALSRLPSVTMEQAFAETSALHMWRPL
jgi:hypothetical protein